jgi:histidinol dehydrogenase
MDVVYTCGPMRIVDLRSDPRLPIPRPDPGEGPLEAVRSILAEVRERGDAALLDFTERFDGVRLDSVRVAPEELERAAGSLAPDLKAAFVEAANRIRAFARHQALQPWRTEVGGGTIGETVHPVARAGIYVPGGRAAYPSSVLMSAIPAAVAGVEEVALCVPPARDGSVPPVTLAAAHLAGVGEVYRIGGAQAVAAMAYGTESVARVDVIAGPGNVYVALAKQEVAGTVQIDSVAGPSEIAIVAEGGVDPDVVAVDLIAQAEHGPHGSFLLVTWDESLVGRVEACMERQLDELGRPADLVEALEEGTAAVVVSGIDQAIDAVNRFAPEHVELIFEGAEKALEQVRAAGAVFVGFWSPVSLGDYLAGTNHVLPTAGAGRWASGLRTSHFQTTTAFAHYDRASLEGSLPYVQAFAAAEGLPNHARAVEARFRADARSRERGAASE